MFNIGDVVTYGKGKTEWTVTGANHAGVSLESDKGARKHVDGSDADKLTLVRAAVTDTDSAPLEATHSDEHPTPVLPTAGNRAQRRKALRNMPRADRMALRKRIGQRV